MRILITGVCGFVGSAVAEALLQRREGLEVHGMDNLQRPGSERNRLRMRSLGINFIYGDIRASSDVESLPPSDWVIDAAANPSVLAGVRDSATSRQLFEHNLASLVNVLEYCKRHQAGLVLLSTSRVYSIRALRALPLKAGHDAFRLDVESTLPHGVTTRGIGPDFSTAAPVSLYGGTKLAAETMALEYGEAFHFPVWVNRCGVLTGAGQFGTPDQGIVAYWVNAHLKRRPLKYIGFEGTGKQVRDIFHPGDLAALVDSQIRTQRATGCRIYTAGGGCANSLSLAQLTAWCDRRFGAHTPQPDSSERLYDIPWVVMDSSQAEADFNWRLEVPAPAILEEIAGHAERHPDWLEQFGL